MANSASEKPAQLISRNIFIDTQFFLDRSLDFQHKEIQALESVVNKGLANVFLTDITEMEIIKKINDEVAIAYRKITSSDVRYVKQIPLFARFLSTYPEGKVCGYILEKFYNFKKQCKVTVVSSESVRVKDIFRSYCNSEPPFDSSSGKNRKGEFPDAFALATINNWVGETRKKTYFLSGDSDWKAFAETTFVSPIGEDDELWLNHIETLAEFLNLLIRNESDLENLTAFADSLIDINLGLIQSHARVILEQCAYRDDDFNPDTEIKGQHVLSAVLTQKEIISVSRDSAVYNLQFAIDLVLKFRTESYENAAYDFEEKVYYNVTPLIFFKRFTVSEPLVLEIEYADGLQSNFQIASFEAEDLIDVEHHNGVEFSPNEWVLKLPVLVCGVLEGELTGNGSGCEHFASIEEAKKIYPDLDIYKGGKRFTAGMGNRINEDLRFETWEANEFYSS